MTKLEQAATRRKVIGRLMNEMDELYQSGVRMDEIEILVHPKVLEQVTGYEYHGPLPATTQLMGIDCVLDERARNSFKVTQKKDRTLYLSLETQPTQ